MVSSIDVCDEVWIATALLHQENPSREDFTNQEILARARQEGLVVPQRPGVAIHVSSHAVAGKKCQPNDYRLLTETARGRRRLFREGDPVHPDRKGKITPSREELPARYTGLLDWYETWSRKHSSKQSPAPAIDPVEALEGTWTFGDGDTYLHDMREGWEGRR